MMMKNKMLLMLLFVFTNLHLFSQDQLRRLNFVLLIDGKVPTGNISEGYFVIQDSIGKVISEVPFLYKIGGLEFNIPDFEKISSLPSKSTLLMKFKFTQPKAPFSQHYYSSYIWLNTDYIIMNIFNKSKRENYEKYDFGKKDYIVQIETSYFDSILHYRSDWLRKHKMDSH